MRFVPNDLLEKYAMGKPFRRPTLPKAKPYKGEYFPSMAQAVKKVDPKHLHLDMSVKAGTRSMADAREVTSGRHELDVLPKLQALKEHISKEAGLNKLAKSYELKKLIEAKGHSDKSDYESKNKVLKELMAKHPQHFKVDSSLNAKYVGLTHKPTGFRIHAPRFLVPTSVEKKAFLLEVEQDDDIFDVIAKKNLYHTL